jgi:dynactin complex subunit
VTVYARGVSPDLVVQRTRAAAARELEALQRARADLDKAKQAAAKATRDAERAKAAADRMVAKAAAEVEKVRTIRRRSYQRQKARKTPPTYQPTAAAIAYREQHQYAIKSLPAPIHGGRAGLLAATREAAAWDAAQ